MFNAMNITPLRDQPNFPAKPVPGLIRNTHRSAVENASRYRAAACRMNPPVPTTSAWLGHQTQCCGGAQQHWVWRSEEHTSELQSLRHLVYRLLLEKKKNNISY